MIESSPVKESDFNKPYIHEIDYFFDDIFKSCGNYYFHTLECNQVLILNLQLFLSMKKSISQLLIDLWKLKLNSMA